MSEKKWIVKKQRKICGESALQRRCQLLYEQAAKDSAIKGGINYDIQSKNTI